MVSHSWISGSIDNINLFNYSPTVEKEEAGYGSKHQDYCHVKLELLILVFVGKSM